MCKCCDYIKELQEIENRTEKIPGIKYILKARLTTITRKKGIRKDKGIINWKAFDINYCPMCRKEARRVKVLKKGKYQKENIITCEKCGCEFQYYDTEIIVDMTTPDEESFLGGFGVHKYLKCPTCNAICTISTDFIEHKSIFTEIKEWWKNLFYASTSKEDK